jgi:hypothetical protein
MVRPGVRRMEVTVSRQRRRSGRTAQRARLTGSRPGTSQVVAVEREIVWTVGLLAVVATAIVLGLPLLLDVAAAAFR